jgi:DNA-binding NarL/FixJ family response regulator
MSRAAAVRVLVVEDFEPFLQFISLTLGQRRDLQVIGEVSDGLKAVQEAVELKPDLIIMDIGLPSLNGIEAARQIRKLVPESKIIFFSQEYSGQYTHTTRRAGHAFLGPQLPPGRPVYVLFGRSFLAEST